MLKDRDSTGGSPVSGGAGGELATAVGCAGCGGHIKDRYYLLAVDRQWHSACLKCCECKLPLDSELTCFARANNIYCKEDYYRLFAVKRCARCQAGISARELVMRARDFVYHVHCFTCAHCQRPLSRGDHFGMRDGLVFCRSHFEELQLYSAASSPHPPLGHHPLHSLHQGIECCGEEEELAELAARGHGVDLQAAESPGRAGSGGNAALSPAFFVNGANSGQKGRPRKRKVPESDLQNVGLRIPPVLDMLHPGELAGPLEQLAFDSSSASSPGNPGTGGNVGSQQGGQRTKRMRTSFKHHQLRTMKSYFAVNQNPDAKDLKQLAQKTGLSKRVLQVWFQNARAKWRRNIMRQDNHQQSGVVSGQLDGSGVMTPNSGPPTHLSQTGDSLSLQSAPPSLMVDDNSAQTLAFSDLY